MTSIGVFGKGPQKNTSRLAILPQILQTNKAQ